MKKIILLLTVLAFPVFGNENNKCVESSAENIKKIENGNEPILKEYIRNCKIEIPENSLIKYFNTKKINLFKSKPSALVCMGEASFLNRELRDSFFYYSEAAALGNETAKINIGYMYLNFKKHLDGAINRPHYTIEEIEDFKKVAKGNTKFNFIDSLINKDNNNNKKSLDYMQNCLDIIKTKNDILTKNFRKFKKFNRLQSASGKKTQTRAERSYAMVQYIYFKENLQKLENAKEEYEDIMEKLIKKNK